MNKVYKCVWNAALGVWSVASELASAKKKTKSSVALNATDNSSKSMMQKVVLLTAIASLGGVSTSAYSVAVHAEETNSTGRLFMENVEFWKLLTNGMYNSSLNDQGYATGGAIYLGSGSNANNGSLAFGTNATAIYANSMAGATSVGSSAYSQGGGTAVGSASAASNSAVALGRNALADKQSVAIGRGAAAQAESSIAIGRSAHATASNSVAIGNNSSVSQEDTVSFGHADLQRKLTNVAKGQVSSTSVDAINGSQLYSSNLTVADALGGGSTVDANGNITAPNYSVDGKSVNNVGDAISNVDGRVTTNSNNITTNTTNIAGNTKNITDNTTNITNLNKTLSDGAFSVSANGTGATKVGKDAVIDFANRDGNITVAQEGTNLSFGLADQLTIKNGLTVGNSSLTSDGLVITGGPALTKNGLDAGNTSIKNIQDGVAATDAVSKGQLDKGLRDSGLIDADGKAIDAVTYTADGNVILKGNDGKGTLISNVANGKVSADSTDAINGGQLYSANSNVAGALGGGSTVDANGNITAPNYSVGGTTVNNVGDAISNVDGRVTTNSNNITTNTTNIAGNTKNITDNTTNITNLNKTLNDGAFSVSANGTGETKVGKDAVINFANRDGNITVAQDGTNLSFGLADQLTIKNGLTVGGSSLTSDGLVITGGPALTKNGLDAGNTSIKNIQDGVVATDAVSKGQFDKGLRDSGLIDADGKAMDAVTYTAEGNVILKGNDGKGTLISNVANGKVSADSTDAINGGQLYNANSNVAGALGGGSTVDANGNITAPNYSVGGTTVNNVGDAISNVDGRVTTNTTNIAGNTKNITDNTTNITNLNKTLSDGAFSVSANGTGATKVGKDAVINFANRDGNITVAQEGTNLSFGLADQLTIKNGLTVGGSSLTSDGLVITGGPALTKNGLDAGNTSIKNIQDGVAATDAVSKGQFDKGLRDSGLIDADGKAIDAVTYTADGNVVLKGNDGKGTVISNVANGKVSADSTDAINGGQLYNANSNVAGALGGGSTVDANGNITAPNYSVDGKSVNNVGDAISNVDGRVTTNTTNIAGNTKNITDNTTNITNLNKTLSDGAFSVSANGTGATKVGKDAVINFANRDGNITVAQEGTNLTFGLADQLTIKNGLTVGNSSLTSDGLVITGGPSLTKNGLDAGNTSIKNIQDGVAATDAVSKGQLDKGLRDSGLIDADGKAIDAVTYTADGNVVLKGNDGKGTLISNVANGKVSADSTDAINGGQLYNANSNVAGALGGGSTVDANGNITAPNYSVGGTTVNNVGDAISNVDGRVTTNTTNIAGNTKNITDNTTNITNLNKTLTDGAFSVSANGTGATKVGKDAVIDFANRDGNITVAQDGTNLTFGLADQLTIKNGLTVGSSSLTNDGLVITGGPALTKNGLDAGNTSIKNIQDGVDATDAVSKGQLDKGLRDSGLIDADGKAIDAVTYTADGNVILKGNDGKGTLISNVANGKVSADSTDAINGGQLYNANSNVAGALGGGSTVDANGNITAPNYSVDGKSVNNVGDAISNVDGRVTTNSNNISTNTTNIAGNTKNITDNTTNITNLNKTLSDGAFSVSTNGTGATKVGKDAVINFANRDGNITVAQEGTNLTFGLADQLTIKNGLTVGNSSLTSDGLVITGGPALTKNGLDAGNTSIKNIQDGVDATDAVSKGQLDKGLRDSGLIDADGKAIDAVTYTAEGNVILKGNDGKGTLISNVANGKVSADSTDAINGGQLYNANSNVAGALGGGSTVDANGNITAPNYSVDGKSVNNVGDAISNVDGRVTTNSNNISTNTSNIAGNTKNITDNTTNITNLNKTLSDGAFSVSANGTGATKVGKDAVIDFANRDGNITVAQEGTNLTFGLADQLTIKNGLTVGNSSLTSDGLVITGGPALTKNGLDAGNTSIKNIQDGVAATDAVSKGQFDKGLRDSGLIDADGKAIDAVTYTAEGNVILKGNDGKGTLISNVANGKVSADSTDAINGGQLYNANSNVAGALGGGSTVDANGNITAPNYSVDGTTVNNVGDAISNVDGRVTNNSNNIATNTTNIAGNTKNITDNTTNITNLNKTLTDGAFSVSANGTGAERVARGSVIDYSSQDGNVLISQNGGNFGFGLADHLNIKNSLTVGNSRLTNDGLVISGGPSLTKNGIDAGNTTISNIQEGVLANDAVTKGQLDRSLKESGLVDANGKAVDAVTYAPNGDVVLKDNKGQGTLLTNVADAKVAPGSKDAVNGGQLYDTSTSVANVIGGNTVVNSDGTISTSNIGGTGKDTIDDAIASIQTQVAGSKSTVSGGKNITVSSVTNADGSQNYEVATADDLDVNSVTAKNVNADQVTAKNVAVGNVKIDGSSNKISGVANGTVSDKSTDVVTGAQLHATNNNVAQYLGGGSTVSSNGTISAPTYNVAGGSYHNVGDALTAVDSRVANLEEAFYDTNKNINELKKQANAGIAGAMAVGNLPQPTEAGMSMVSAGASGYSGQTAIAIGVSGITDSNKIIWKMGGTADSKSNVGGAISFGYQWK